MNAKSFSLLVLVLFFGDCTSRQGINKLSVADGRAGMPALRDQIITTVEQCVDRKEPIDVCRLDSNIEALPSQFQGKEKTIHALGRLLVFQGEIHIREGAPTTGRAPEDVLKSAVVRAFSRFNDRTALPYLQRFYQLGGGRKVPQLASIIIALGGTVPNVIQPSFPEPAEELRITEEERQARRSEVQQLVTKMQQKDLAGWELDKIIRRIGHIGEPEDVHTIIEILGSQKVHWIAKQNALEVIGNLGGADAQRFLVSELQKPKPTDADLDDYGDIRAILRSETALGLGNCGDELVVKFLIQVRDDGNEFKRVRQAAAKAISEIKARQSTKEN